MLRLLLLLTLSPTPARAEGDDLDAFKGTSECARTGGIEHFLAGTTDVFEDSQELGAGMPEAGIEQLASLAHAAAVKDDDLGAADAWAARLGRTEPLQEVARINHSLLRLNAEDAEGALAMLRDLEPTSDQADGLVQTVRIRALVALDRLDEATRLSTNTNVSAGEV